MIIFSLARSRDQFNDERLVERPRRNETVTSNAGCHIGVVDIAGRALTQTIPARTVGRGTLVVGIASPFADPRFIVRVDARVSSR